MLMYAKDIKIGDEVYGKIEDEYIKGTVVGKVRPQLTSHYEIHIRLEDGSIIKRRPTQLRLYGRR